jgi:thiopeptide-type bacteriocin biosynthesis protein
MNVHKLKKLSATTEAGVFYTPMTHVMLRSHCLPVETTHRLFAGDWQSRHEEIDLATDPFVSLAILIASPSLHKRLTQVGEKAASDHRLMQKLRNFLVRMSTRPTPFGLMAGIASCTWGRETTVALSGVNRTRTRLEMDWVIDFVRSLEDNSEIAQSIRWVSNSAVWCHANRAILSTATGPAASIACTRPVRLILDRSRFLTPYVEIRDTVLTEISTATIPKFDQCFRELRRLGFVYSELTPPITSEADALTWIIDHLPPNLAGTRECIALEELRDRIRQCDEGPFSDRCMRVQSVAATVSGIKEAKRPLPIQVDMTFGLRGDTICAAVGREAARAAQLLLQTSGIPPAAMPAARYYDAFVAKYGAEREVPFLEMAHPDWGLGLAPLAQFNAGLSEDNNRYHREQLLHEMVQGALRTSETSIELSEHAIRVLSGERVKPEKWPTSIDFNVFVLAKSPQSIDAGDFKVLVGPNIGAMKAGRHFARFGDLLPDAANGLLKESHTLDRNRHPFLEAVELTYMPVEARLANVTLRLPVLGREANYGVSAGVAETGVVRFSDLVVGAKDGRLYVRSSSSDQRLAFSSNSMLVANAAPRECQILLALASDPVSHLSAFRWGSVANGVFLPRLTSGRAILHCAQWRLKVETAPNRDSFQSWFGAWREKWMCPRFVYHCVGDNRLLQDLEESSQVEELRRGLVKQREIILQEALPSADDAWISGVNGKHIVELVVPLRLKNIPVSSDPFRSSKGKIKNREALLREPTRVKTPGSEWTFLKLYGPRSGEDSLIAGPISQFCSSLPATISWFFVRYADPRPHLRIRFHSKDKHFDVISTVARWATELMSQQLCESFSFDIYEREIERYGGLAVISSVEAAFGADSIFAAGLLARRSTFDPIVLRVFILDRLLESLGLTERHRTSWSREVVELKPEDGIIYREKRKVIGESLTSPPIGFLLEVTERLEILRTALGDVSHAISIAEDSCSLTEPAASIHRSIVHMHYNRLWGVDNEREMQLLRLFRRAREQITFVRNQQCAPAE